jgi:alpha/beta hydrolase fold
MTQVSVIAPDKGEAIQLGPIQMRILEDGRTTGHRLGVGEITIPPGIEGPPQHRHAQHDEGFSETVPPEQAAQRAANMATMRVFAADPYMHDPGLSARLGQVEIPVLVLWGDSDRIVTPAYGQALAAAFPQAQFAIIAEAGHLPQIEQPAATFGALDAYINKNVSR